MSWWRKCYTGTHTIAEKEGNPDTCNKNGYFENYSSGVSQIEKDKYHTMSLCMNFKKRQTPERESIIVPASGWGGVIGRYWSKRFVRIQHTV